MKTSFSRRAAVLMLALAVSSLSSFGQDKAAVIKLFNDGVRQIPTSVDSAIISFENVISMSEKVGPETDNMKQEAAKVLPGLYLKSASAMYTAKKPDAEVIAATKKAIAAGEKYGNTQVKENASKLMSQVYTRMASESFKNKDYDKALASFDSVLAINPDNAAVIYNKALIYRTQNNADAMEQAIDDYLKKIPAGDEKGKPALKMGLEYFRAAGSKANQANKLDEALALLNKAAKYGEDKDLYYYFADVYNKQKNFDKGAENAQKGLDLEIGAPEAKAKFYFQLGLAQAGQGKTADACASFTNAMYGLFAEPSKAQRTNLKCQ